MVTQAMSSTAAALAPPAHFVPTLPLHVMLPHRPLSGGIVHLPPPDAAAWMGAFAAVILAVVTAALAYFTWRLWRSTGELVRGADDTSKRELRAYVAVREVNITASRVNESPTANMVVTNFGRTPAYRLSLSAALEFGKKETNELPELSAAPEIGHLAPGADLKSDIYAPFCLLRDGAHAISGATHAVFLHGVIRYTDTFGTCHLTRFKVKTNPWLDTTTCGEGNDTDDDALLPAPSAVVERESQRG